MIRAVIGDTDYIASLNTERSDKYTCPCCGSRVVLKKGTLNIPHFSHYSLGDCINNISETKEHILGKLIIYNKLKDNHLVSKLQMERYLGEVRPDISFIINNKAVAIEVQHSAITTELIEHRMNMYKNKNIYVIWVNPDALIEYSWKDNFYSPKKHERYLHGLYFGNLFFLNKDGSLRSMSISQATDERVSGSGDVYTKFFKRKKVRKITNWRLDIVNDFKCVKKPAWGDRYNESLILNIKQNDKQTN